MFPLLLQHIESKLQAPLSQAAIESIRHTAKPKSFSKKEFLLREGDYGQELFLVAEGALCSYFTSPEGQQQVVQFAFSQHWISGLYSFFSEEKALYSIQALTESSVLSLSKAGFDRLCLAHPEFERFFRILIQNAYVANQYHSMISKVEDAETRYLSFIQQYPQALALVPQYLIASYLGIKSQSLSRIRKKMSER